MDGRARLLAGLLVLALGSGAVAQESSPDLLMGGQRVEVPEAGVALTVPASWEVRMPMEPGPGATLQVLGAYEVGSGYCVLTLQQLDDPTLLDDATAFRAFVDTSMWLFRADPDMEVSDAMTEVTLGAGPALRVDMVERIADGDLHNSVYAVDTPDGLALLDCGGFARPDDDWLSIAETFEFLPTEE